MKIRSDFVTNSSSSSYIIRTKEELEEKKHSIIKITKENVVSVISNMFVFYTLSPNYDNETIKKMFNLSEEQFLLLRLMDNSFLGFGIEEYIEIKKALDREGYIYYIGSEDYYNNNNLDSIVKRSEEVLYEN